MKRGKRTKHNGARAGQLPFYKTNIPRLFTVEGELFQARCFRKNLTPVFYKNTLFRKVLITFRIAFFAVVNWYKKERKNAGY